MAFNEKWYFTKEQLQNTPSRKNGFDDDKELSYRQHAANFIQEMGQKLVVSQLCINTGIVYMHRFYVFHSFSLFHRNAIAVASLFLATKVEEQRRRLDHVIKVANICLHRRGVDTKSPLYFQQVHDLVVNENLMLQTFGFDVAVEHPHTHVERCCKLVRASEDLARTSYFLTTNSLHLTTMCLQYKPAVVACFCFYLACKWSRWNIPKSREGKEWYWYIDKSVTLGQLQHLTSEFLTIFEKSPTKLKQKVKSITGSQESDEHNLKRRRIESLSANKSAILGTMQRGTKLLPTSSNQFVKEQLPNTSNLGADIVVLKMDTSREHGFQKPSTSTAHSSTRVNFDPLAETSSHQSLDRMNKNTSILHSEGNRKRDQTVNEANRIKSDEKNVKRDISKQYAKGDCSMKYNDTNNK